MISSCLSPCSLDCFAFAVKAAVHSKWDAFFGDRWNSDYCPQLRLLIDQRIWASSGCHVAPPVRHHRGPANGWSQLFSFTHPFSDRHVISQVLISLNLNGIVTLFSTRMWIALNSAITVRPTQLRTFVVVTTLWRFSNRSVPQISQLTSLVTMTIAATRTYRSLTDFASSPTDMYAFSCSTLLSRLLLAANL